MQFLRQLFNFYINASIHVALAVYALVRITESYFELPYNEPLDYFIFYGTITGYNFVKYAEVAKLHHRSLTKHLKIIQIFSLCCFLLMLFYASKLSVKTIVFFVPFGLLTFLYAVPFFYKFQKNLRSISYFKIIVVAIVWTGVTIFLPLFNVDKSFSIQFYLMTIQRFLLVVVLILPFDIRDLQYDATSLQTIPKKIGVKNTKKLGWSLLCLSIVLEFLISNENNFRVSFLLISILTSLLLLKSSEKQSKYYSSFWVESIPVLWWVLLSIL